MSASTPPEPSRPVEVGDLVTTFQESLDAWTAAQVIQVDPDTDQVILVVLDWAGPRPTDVGDLAAATVLMRTASQPRQGPRRPDEPVRVAVVGRRRRGVYLVGQAPLLLPDGKVTPYAMTDNEPGWGIGEPVAHARDAEGELGSYEEAVTLAKGGSSDPRVDTVEIRHPGGEVDLGAVVTAFPRCRTLDVFADLGDVRDLGALRALPGLRSLTLVDVLGLDAGDVLTPADLPALEYLWVASVPTAFLSAMRKAWSPSVVPDVRVLLSQPRTPQWVSENRDNPFRAWDGSDEMRPAQARAATKAFVTLTRALGKGPGDADATNWTSALGADYAQAFNALDRRPQFIGTAEREQVIDAGAAAVRTWAATAGRDDAETLVETFVTAVDAARDW